MHTGIRTKNNKWISNGGFDEGNKKELIRLSWINLKGAVFVVLMFYFIYFTYCVLQFFGKGSSLK